MISEAIKIVVKLESGRKLQTIETIYTDGSYNEVDLAASRLVGKVFGNDQFGVVERFHWEYV